LFRHRRTPLFLQSHASECGAACLGSILAHFGRWVTLTDLRTNCEVSRDGVSAAGIKRAAGLYGLDCTGRSSPIPDLRKMSFPLILFWEFNHFLILDGVDRDRYLLNDPSSGHRTLTEEEFSRGYTGIALEFRPNSGFQPGGNRPGILTRIPLWLSGSEAALVLTALCSLVLALLALLPPALLAIFIDRVLDGNEPWGGRIAGAMAVTAVLFYGLTLIKQRWLKRLAIRVSVIAGNHRVGKMFRLPMEFFNHRLVGDLTVRILSIDRIARGISEKLFGGLVEVVMSLVFFAVMLLVSPKLALVVLGIAVSHAALAYWVTHLRADKALVLRREQGLLAGIGTLMLNQAEALRMTASEDRFFTRWSGQQARELSARQSFTEFTHLNTSLTTLFMILGNAAVLVFGGMELMDGSMTLGTLAGFYLLANMFLSTIGHGMEFNNDRLTVDVDMQRLEDIKETPAAPETVSPTRVDERIHTLDRRLKLTGHVEIRNISFGYNRSRPPLLKDFSLTILPGQRIAVVGPSGSGKSTVAHLLTGLYPPWSGEVLFDGHPHDRTPREVLSRSLSVVDQHINLFSGSMRDNITLWNPSIPDEAIVTASMDACIHNEILLRPLGYETRVHENGRNFSGGQKQRIAIARALVTDPTVLILDEATSALDAVTEEAIDDALRRRGATCLIVAHRLSTIRDCDQIIVLDKGAVVERGLHEELMMNPDGLYRELVQAS